MTECGETWTVSSHNPTRCTLTHHKIHGIHEIGAWRRAHMNGYIHAYISTYLHTYVHVCMHACMCTFIHARVFAWLHVCTHTLVHPIQACMHKHTDSHTTHDMHTHANLCTLGLGFEIQGWGSGLSKTRTQQHTEHEHNEG